MKCKGCPQEVLRIRKGKQGVPIVFCSKQCCITFHQRKHNQRFRDWLETQKSKPCMDCGKTFPRCCMEFDHRPDETKEFYLGRSKCMPLERRIAEIAKCDLVCACCHRIRTESRKHLKET